MIDKKNRKNNSIIRHTPSIIHHPSSIIYHPSSIILIGHRGIPVLCPENTLAGFEKAVELGATGLEFDVRHCATKGKVPVIHDDTVDRTTGGAGTVSALTYDALAQLNTEKGQPIPFLEQVVQRFGDSLLLVEIKTRECVADVARLVRGYNNVVVIGFDSEALRDMRRLEPSVRLGLNVDTEIALTSALSGKEEELFSLNPRVSLLTPEIVAQAHARGMKVYTWTCNSEEQIRHAMECGADGIMSDDVRLVSRIIREYEC